MYRLGLNSIVYVSSELALLPPAEDEVVTADSPVRQPPWPYCRSKADSELVARGYQRQGAPVVSVMPAAVWGPHDPRFGEGVTRTTNVLKKRYPIVMRGGMHIADVRDVAAVLAAVMTPGRGQRRLPWDGEGIWVVNCAARCDDSKTRSEFGLEPRSLQETITDTIQWLAEVGRVTAREAGRLGESAGVS